MKNPVFATVCVLLFASFLQFYSYARYKFSGIDHLRDEVSVLKKDLEKQKFHTEVAKYELEDYRQHIATLLPKSSKENLSLSSGHQLRSLASVVSEPTNEVKVERASSLFESARNEFRAKSFEESNRLFSKLIRSYPESVHSVESHFLLTEGLFQQKEYDNCVAVVESMMALFPEHDLTGFALLRLGKVFEAQDRVEDAADVYQAVLRSYGDATLRQQAASLLRAVEQ